MYATQLVLRPHVLAMTFHIVGPFKAQGFRRQSNLDCQNEVSLPARLAGLLTMIRPKLFSFFLLYIFAVLTPLVHPAPTSLDIRSPDNGIEAKLRQHGFGSLTDWTVFKDWFEKTSKSTWSKGPPSSQFAQGQFIAPGNLVEGNFVEDQCDGNYFYFAYARKNSDALTWRPLPENAGPLPLTEYLNGGGFVPGPGKTWRAFIKTSVSTLPLQGAELQMKAWAKDDVHIARVFDYFWVPDEDNGRSYLAMQTWGVVSEITPEIVAHIRGFPDGPKRLLELFRHLSVGVKNMHSAKVYHRDLKAENTLAYFHNRAHIYVAAIVDFDFATDQAELKKDDPHPGTPGYMAPGTA